MIVRHALGIPTRPCTCTCTALAPLLTAVACRVVSLLSTTGYRLGAWDATCTNRTCGQSAMNERFTNNITAGQLLRFKSYIKYAFTTANTSSAWSKRCRCVFCCCCVRHCFDCCRRSNPNPANPSTVSSATGLPSTLYGGLFGVE